MTAPKPPERREIRALLHSFPFIDVPNADDTFDVLRTCHMMAVFQHCSASYHIRSTVLNLQSIW
ncbi:hypothetical protein [Ruegeria sp. HKCCA0370]|uniref:hypothetical protein n=1 Tax=Ruegeria sp. HKCCA0370 TaxID=2682995 RepID=UPI001487D70F|nr:hypothetical protein [Ruegeria sp. HKCCA0370]